jgi:hypothetical protein
MTGNCAVEDLPAVPEISCGVDLTKALDFDSEADLGAEISPSVEFGQPLQDWFELALQAETPVRGPVRNSWGEDDEDAEDEIPADDVEEDDQDPFEDFDEDDFDDDFDDDFEEELEDEYEIEPSDEGLVPGAGPDVDEELLDDEESVDLDPGIEDID